MRRDTSIMADRRSGRRWHVYDTPTHRLRGPAVRSDEMELAHSGNCLVNITETRLEVNYWQKQHNQVFERLLKNAILLENDNEKYKYTKGNR